jgi:hypothetical protein
MDKETSRKILQEVRENIKRLEECVGPHDFKKIDNHMIFSDFICTKCQGKVDGIFKSAYNQGLKHGQAK